MQRSISNRVSPRIAAVSGSSAELSMFSIIV
jgi:hypothetical protein